MPHPNFQAGWVVLKSSGGERAWFLAEGSEPRNKLRLMDLWNKSIGSSKGGKSPLVAGQSPRRGGSESKGRALEGESCVFPSKRTVWEDQRAEESACLMKGVS
jgi:hypothetical protein